MEELLKEVPINKKGETAKFYTDRVEFKGKVVKYDQIKSLSVNAELTTHRVNFIPMGRSFSGYVRFDMNDGKKVAINLNAMSILGIPFGGRPKKKAELFPELFEATYTIIAKSMAQKYIDSIRGGASVEVADLIIDSRGAKKAKPKAKEKDEIIISKDNYERCQLLKGYRMAVVNKTGTAAWESYSRDNKDVLLIPYILDATFGDN